MQTVVARRVGLSLLILGVPIAWAVDPTSYTPGRFSITPSGESHYSVPIDLPRGAGGLTPSLGFEYGTQRGNGLLGMGLRIAGFSVIHRCPHTLAQDGQVRAVSMTTTDKLCLDGNKLRLTGGAYGAAASTYQTELETFVKVTANRHDRIRSAVVSGQDEKWPRLRIRQLRRFAR